MTGEFHLVRSPKKKAWIAHLLNLVFPGVGIMYWRRDASGLLWLFITSLSFVGLMSFWMISPFLPQLLASLLGLLWITLQWVSIQEVNQLDPLEAKWRRGPYGATPFVGVALLCVSLMSLVAYLSLTRVYSLVQVQDNSMFPTLLQGDILLVDRRVKEGEKSQVGSLVVYNSTTTGVSIARVIASPDEASRVEVNGVQVRWDDTLLRKEPVAIDVPRFQGKERERLNQRRYYLERPPMTDKGETSKNVSGWFVSEPIDKPSRPFSLSGHLGLNTLLVLPDSRNEAGPQVGGRGEIIDRARILGVPVMIVTTRSEAEEAETRRGLRLD